MIHRTSDKQKLDGTLIIISFLFGLHEWMLVLLNTFSYWQISSWSGDRKIINDSLSQSPQATVQYFTPLILKFERRESLKENLQAFQSIKKLR